MQADGARASSEDRTGQFLRLLGQHEHSLYTFVLAMVPRWADAEDIVQETRIRLWEQFDKYQPDKDFGAWARTIAYYLVLAHRKQSKRDASRFSEAFCEAIAAQASESPSIVYDRQEALLHCLEELDEGKRRLVQRYYGGKESKEELARTLKRSYEALRKAIYRTLLSLSNCVELAPAKGDPEMSNENTPRSGLKEEIHLLAHGALSGDLRGAQARRLERLIVENPEARRLYYECICDVYNLRKCVDRSAGTRDHVLHTEEQDRFEATLAELSAGPPPSACRPRRAGRGTNARIPIVGLRRDRKSRESRVQGLLHRMIQAGGGTPAAAAMTWTVMAIFAGGAVLTLTFIAMIVFGVKPPAGQPEVAGRIERSAESRTPSFVSSAMHRAPRLTPVARLVRVADCIWEENAVAPKAGDDLLPGRKLQLKAGLAQIFFQGGAATVLEGPAKLEIRSTMGGISPARQV